MYKVIGSASSRTFRVLWMLEELGEAYEHLPAAPHSSDVYNINPSGKIPILVSDGTPVTDSTAILQYLADKHGRLTFKAGTLERARQDSLTQFLLDEFDAALWMAARHSFVLPKELRFSAVKDSLKWEFQRSQKALVKHMANGPFLMGEQMTVPDIILAHCCLWADSAKFPICEHKLMSYSSRIRDRQGFAKVNSLA